MTHRNGTTAFPHKFNPPSLFACRIAVMYGSQTGNAQSIAEGLHEGLEKRGVESTLLKCDGWKKVWYTPPVGVSCFALLNCSCPWSVQQVLANSTAQ